MSGLASKWAAEEGLVNKAKVQDNESRNHSTPSHKTSIPNRNETSKPLESKWANTSNEHANTSAFKDHRDKFDGSSKFNRSGKMNRGKRDRKPGNDAYGTLPSPPTTAEKDAFPNDLSNSHVPGAGSGNIPKGPRANKTPANNKQGKHPKNKRIDYVEESEKEGTLPMSNAGASFAARLGAPLKSNNLTSSVGVNKFENTGEEVTDDEDDGFEDIEKNEEDEEFLSPMGSGQSLASRLGLVSVADAKSQPPKAKQNMKHNAKQIQLQTKLPNDPPRQTKPQKGAYQTPKQKREEQAKKEQAEKEKLQKQKDAMLKEEVRDMFSKLTNSSANWADLEDED